MMHSRSGGKLAVQEKDRVVGMQVSFGLLLKQSVYATSVHVIEGLAIVLVEAVQKPK
jgi:hypothetical protein